MKYGVYVDRTGIVYVQAESEDDARQQVMDMSTAEIEAVANLTGFDVGDAFCEMEDVA